MENLRALVYGRSLSAYQRKLAQREFEGLEKAGQEDGQNESPIRTPYELKSHKEVTLWYKMKNNKFEYNHLTEGWTIERRPFLLDDKRNAGRWSKEFALQNLNTNSVEFLGNNG